MKPQSSQTLTNVSHPLNEVRDYLSLYVDRAARASRLVQHALQALYCVCAARSAQATQAVAYATRAVVERACSTASQHAALPRKMLIWFLCFCLLVQPNAAFAARATHTITPAPRNWVVPPIETSPSVAKVAIPAPPSDQSLPHDSFNDFFLALPVPTITDAAISRHHPSLNGGRIEGSLRVFSGESYAINSPFQLTSDLYALGTPQINVNSGASHGGTINDGGAATPANYSITLNSGLVLPGKIHIHADAMALPTDIPTSVPAAAGTRTVNINTANDVNSIAPWNTVRDLNVTPANLVINVPPGNYNNFNLNSASRLNFTAGTYNFAGTINLNGGASIQTTGRVDINIAQAFNLNQGSIIPGTNTLPGDVHVNAISTGGCTLNGSSQLTGLLRCPNSPFNLNGTTAVVTGQVIANYLNINTGKITGNTSTTGAPDTTAPTVSITSPANNSTTTSAAITVSGTAADPGIITSGIAQVTVNNAAATYTASNGTWTIANVALALGANTITARATDNAGNVSALQSIVVTRTNPPDTTPPVLAVTSPANNSTTQASTITVSGTALDVGSNASGLAQVTVNGVAAALNTQAGTWTIGNVALTLGSNTITARATDIAGNFTTQVITVTRQSPPDTTAPTLAIGSPANGSSTQAATITVSGTVSDPGQNASGVAQVTVNGTSATLNVGAGTWTIANVALTVGSNTIAVHAVDQAGNAADQSITITRQPPPDTTAPTLAITSPANNSTTQAETTSVSGTVSDPGQYASGVTQVTVNGVAAVIDSECSWLLADVALAVGPNTITARAVDNAGNASTQTFTVYRATPLDTQAPMITITSPVNNFTSPDAAITVTGTAVDSGAYATGVSRVVVNGQTANYDSATHQWTATGITLAEGANAIQAFAEDGAPTPNRGQTSINVTRHTPDTTAPTVTITTPTSAIDTYDASINVAGTALDDGLNATGVQSITVNGVPATYNATNGQWSAGAVPLVYGDNSIVVLATDGAPTSNQGRAEVHVTRLRIPPPTLLISSPQNGAVLGATSITVAGSVSSLGSVSVTINGQSAPVSGGQFASTVSLTDGANTIAVIATDEIAQQTQSSFSVIRDLSPPTVSFANIPASVQPGDTYQVLVDATDNVGIADVEFRVNGQSVAIATTAPYQFSLTIPLAYDAGSTLVLSAVARDLTNATTVATAQTRTAGPGGISGYVFDDTTGYVLPGVSAQLNGDASVVTNDQGIFTLVAGTPTGVVRLSKGGYTPVERLYSVSIGEGSALFDARLTPLDSHANLIGLAGGIATGDSGRLQVSFNAGTFADPTDIRVTNVSPQGLANLLPYGWSPVPGAVVDLRTATANGTPSQQNPAHLVITQVAGLTAASPLVLARYDEVTHRWTVMGKGLAAGDNGALNADLPQGGQYAYLIADAGATAPPAPAVGQPLTASAAADSAALDSAQASAAATPRTAAFSASARSAISFFAIAPAQLPSGVSIEATFGDTYNLLGGKDSVLVDRPAQDFVLYAYPAAGIDQPNRLGALFVAKPTRTDFTITELFNANVHVEIRSGRQTKRGVLIGASGGELRAADGSQLTIPAAAVPGSLPVFFNDVPRDQVNVTLPAAYEIVAAFDIDLASASLSNPATISVPGISGDASRIVVARLVTVGGQRSPKVVARAVIDADGKLNSTIAPPTVPAGVVLSGIRTSGRYLFIRLPQAFGYVQGQITDAGSNAPVTMVKVTDNQTPFIDVTGIDGKFVVVGSAGANAPGVNQIGAAALTTDATGKGTASLNAQDEVATANIPISAVALAVDSIAPASGAQNMIATTPVTITFNKPVASSSVTGSSLTLSTASGNPVLGNITTLAGNRIVVFTPAATLAASTSYRVSLTQSVRDIYGHPLGAGFNSTFTTAATVTISNRLRPEQIAIGYPDENGISSISLPAGSVPEGSTILVVNTTSGSTVSTVAGTAALLLQIQARVGDEITLTINQPDGTQYSVRQAAYHRADGFISVGANGGTITSDDGTLLLQIPAGAISGQADLKLSLARETDITIPRTGEMDPSIAVFGGGVKIEAQGSFTNNKELHLELPAPASAQEGQRVFFMKQGHETFDDGEADVWETITSGKVEDGKIKSTSPPFLGVTLAGVLVGLTIATTFFVFMPIHVRAVTGIVQKVNPGHPASPIPDVRCVVSSTGGNHPSIVTHSAANGRFCLVNFAFTADATVTVTATDPAGAPHLAVATPYNNTEPGLIGIQSLFATVDFPSDYQGLSPALLKFEGKMLNLQPDQHDTLQSSGRVATGSRVKIKVTATPVVADFTGDLLVNGAAPQQLVWEKTVVDGSSVYQTDFEVINQGSYSITATTKTIINRPETKATGTYNFVALSNPNVRPPLAGPPTVLSVTPIDKAQQIDVGSKIRLEFSEPVKNLKPGITVYLSQTGTAAPAHIGGKITSGDLPVDPLTPNISTIDFEPERILEGGKEYKVTVTSEVLDSDGHHLDQQPAVPDVQDFTSTFKTFEGLVLTPTPQDDDSFRIAALGDYAVTAHFNSGAAYTPTGELTVYDVSSPQTVKPIGKAFVRGRPLAVAMSEEKFEIHDSSVFLHYDRIAVVTTTSTPDIVRPNNIWIYNLDNPEKPILIGVVSLSIPQATPEIPAQVTIHKKRAYIGTVVRGGCVVVDLEQAIGDFQRDVYNVIPPGTDPYYTQPVELAVTPQGGYDKEAQKQKASYGGSVTDPTPVTGLSVIDQNVGTGNVALVAPVAYVVPNKAQLISFNLDPSRDGILNFYDGDNDGRDDRVLAKQDLSPFGYPVDVKAVSGVVVSGGSKDLAVDLGMDRLWIFDVSDPRLPTQYPSKTFADMGMAATETARRMELEGTILYVMFDDKVAVIDISDPSKPYITATIKGIGTGLRWFAVQDGFIYTLAADSGTGKSGIRVSIGRAVAQVIVYGLEKFTSKICGNPVVVDRNTNKTAEAAEIFFQIYGHDLPQTAKVIVRKVNISGNTRTETVIETLPAVLDEPSTPNIVSGISDWPANVLIDQSYIYTAEVVLDQGAGAEFHSKQTEIPFSYLVPFASQSIGIKANGDKQTGQFGYMLAGTATIKLEIEGVRIPLKPRLMPEGIPADIWERPFGVGKESFDLPAPKPDGRYRFTFTATLKENPAVIDVVEGEVVVGNSSTDVRKPGSPVIDDVELGSGNLALSTSDIEVKGRGLSLSLSRFYNSRGGGQFNPLGYGWRHSYQVLLTRTTERDISGNPIGTSYSLDGAEGGSQSFNEARQVNGKMTAAAPYLGVLVKNADSSLDFFTKSHTKYHFRQALEVGGEAYQNLYYIGNLDYIEDPNGNRISLSYDGFGRMNRVTDSSGRSLNFEYELAETPFVGIIPGDPSTGGCVRRDKFKQLLSNLQQSQIGRAWRLKRVGGPGGISVTYEYDTNGNLNFVRRAGYDDLSSLTSDRVWEYAYNPGSAQEIRYEHLLKSVKAPNNGSEITRVTTYEYDLTKPALLPVKKVNMPEGVSHSLTYEYGENNTKIIKTDLFDGNNQKTTFTLDASGRPTGIAGPRGDFTTLTWTDFGQITSKLDAEGMITTIEYDENQNARWTTTTGFGKTIKVGTKYDEKFSKLIELKDGNGKVTSYHLDSRGNVHEIELPTGSKITLDYLLNGDLRQVEDQYGAITTYSSYDPYGNPGLITHQVGGSSLITQNTYDTRSRLLTSSDTIAPSIANTYDALDRLVEQTVTDPSGYRAEMTMTAQYLPEGQAKTMKRLGGGQSLEVVNKYDGLSRLRQATETASGAGAFVRTFTYDANSNLLTETNRRGVTITRTYDALNFVRSVAYSRGNEPAIKTWDATGADDVDKVGNTIHVKDQYGKVTSFEYDGMHRLKLRTLPAGYTEEFTYDNNNNILTTTDRKGRVTTTTYDPLNRLLSRTEPASRSTTWTYEDAAHKVTMELAPQGLTEVTKQDALGRLLSREVKFGSNTYTTSNVYDGRKVTTTDARGTVSVSDLSAFQETGQLKVNGASPSYSVVQHFGAFGARQSITDPLGRETTFSLDGFNRAMQINYSGGTTEQFGYDGEGLPLSHTDRRGTVQTMTYDTLGRKLTTQVANEQGTIPVLTVAYDDTNNQETRTDGNNNTTTYSFDGLHRVVQLQNAEGKSKNYTYDGMNLLTEQDFKGKLTTYEYDDADRLKLVKDRTGHVTSIANSDNGGYTRSLTDRRGNPRVEVYDPLGRLIRVTDGGGLLARYEYDGANNRTLLADGRGNQAVYSYDKLNRLITANHASLQTETFAYDAAGNSTRYNDGRGADVTMTYDELGHLRTQTDGEGNLTSFQYDGEGLLLSKTEPKGASYKTTYKYNALGSLVQSVDAKGGVWQFVYDNTQNLKSVKDALNRTVSYDYDALNRLRTITQPQGLVSTFGYDANNNRNSVTDPKGQTTTIAYDDLDRPLTLAYAGTTGPGPRNYSYSYDPEGNLTKVDEQSEPAAIRSYARSYDARNRLKTSTDPFGHTVTMGYDAANNLTSVRDAELKETTYAYDARNRVQTVSMPGGASAAYSWHPDGLLQRVDYGADMKREYSYDNADRLRQVTNTVGTGAGTQVQEFAYSYDANSNRETETRKYNGQTTRSVAYGYDLLDRLSGATYVQPGQRPANPAPGHSVSYAETTTKQTGFDYDGVGNRTLATAQDRSVVVTLTTGDEGNVSESRQNNDGPVLTATSQFDALNRLTNLSAAGIETVYAYDNNGNLTSARENGQLTGTYDYDVRDQLRRVANGSNQQIASYDYDCERHRLSKTVGNGTLQYVYAGSQVVNEYGAGNQLVNRYDLGSGEVIRAELGGEGERYYFGDVQGSVTALARKAAGSLTTAYTNGYEYDAWGQYLSSSGASYNSIGYTGQRADYETGLMALGNGERYYSPSQGRFLQQDSFGGMLTHSASLNRYAYAHNNPAKFTDPSGHLLPGLILIAFLLGVLYGVARQDAEIKDGTRQQIDFSLSEAIVYQGLPAAAAAPVLAMTGGYGLLLAAGMSGYGIYQGAQEVRQGHSNTGRVDIAAGVFGLLLTGVGAYKGGYLGGKVGPANPYALAEQARTPSQMELPFEPAAEVGPRQPELPFGESVRGRSTSSAMEESVAPDYSRQMRLPFDGPEPEQLSFNFEEPTGNTSPKYNSYDKTPSDLYRFGPQKPLRVGQDAFPDEHGIVGPEEPPAPHGLSLYSDPLKAPLTGKYYRLPAGTELPEGVKGLADGKDVFPNSKQSETHNTLYPERRMPLEELDNKLKGLPFDENAAGNKKKPK